MTTLMDQTPETRLYDSDNDAKALLLLLYSFNRSGDAAQRAKVLLYFHQGKADTLTSQVTLCLNSVDLFTLS